MLRSSDHPIPSVIDAPLSDAQRIPTVSLPAVWTVSALQIGKHFPLDFWSVSLLVPDLKGGRQSQER